MEICFIAEVKYGPCEIWHYGGGTQVAALLFLVSPVRRVDVGHNPVEHADRVLWWPQIAGYNGMPPQSATECRH